jgi:hypothetical protein
MSGLMDGFGDDSNPAMEGLADERTERARAAREPEAQEPEGDPEYFTQEVAEDAAVEDEMDEMERRFYKASLYHDLLKSPLFEQNGNAITAEIQAECDEFFKRKRQEAMAGVTKSGAGTLLTDQRLNILAMMADAVARNPKLQSALGLKATEVAAVKDEPAVPAARPQVRTRPVPAVVQQSAPPRTAIK